MRQDKFLIAKTDDAKDLPLPGFMSDMAAGMDLYANVTDLEVINGGEIKLIPTGIKISMPYGYEAQIRPRSGLALKHGIGMVNSPGTIDADYRGEIKVILINLSKTPFTVKRGDRIAQMVVNKLPQIKFEAVDSIGDDTDRGAGGFGHTGV